MKTTELTVSMGAPSILNKLEEELKNLEEIKTSAYKCPAKLESLDIQKETSVENLVKAFSSVITREKAYNEAQSELNLKETPVPAFTIAGCTKDQWKEDITLRIKIITHEVTYNKLKTFKDQMSQFLSEEDRKKILLQEMNEFLNRK